MASIQVLSEQVVDQIAAGEVVERPASVVKELVENALDAGAGHVDVEVEGGGKSLIRVVDDGAGMTADDAALALRRHATSKLRALDDLFGLSTLGFRGEALPSIAAVSRMTLTTRPRAGGSDVPAVRLEIEGGQILSTREVGAPVGTRIEVRDLLYNVPARLKFLKGDATEASHITDAVSKLALANPGVHIKLRHRSRTALNAPLHREGLERVRAVLGKRLGGGLHRTEGREQGIHVEAYLAAPELSKTTSRGLQLFVGRRPVRDRGLLHAVARGYGELVPRGRYPVAVVFVQVPDPAVDVNVHPQKLEVRFADPQAVYAAVRHTVSRGVAEAPWLQESVAGRGSPVRMEALAASGPPSPAGRASELAQSYAAERARMLFSMARPGRLEEAPFPLARRAPDAPGRESDDRAPPRGEGAATPAAPGSAASHAEPAPGFFSELRYVGQLDRTYLVCEADGEMVLLDQHAAHERVEFQRLRERCRRRDIPVQRLLFPETIDVDETAAAVVQEHEEELAVLGFEVEPFGGRGSHQTVAVKAVPAGLADADTGRVLRQLLDELADRGGSRALEERLDLALATIACHSVVRAGDALSPREVEALLTSMDGVDYRAHCPHGRPVLLRIGFAEIARRFGR